MSDFNLDDDLILDYLAECREHLATIETDLLSMEQAGAAIDEQIVNRVFRAAHSIKGGAGFFDLLRIKELAHRTENVLDLVRSRQIVPDPAIVSILLLAFDKLSNLIQDYRSSNEADISEFTDALSRLTEDHLNPGRKGSPEEVVRIALPNRRGELVTSAFELDQARSSGKKIYLIAYDLIHDIQRRGKTPLEVLNHLMKCGVILDTEFDLASAGTLDDEVSNQLILNILYSTVLDSDSVTQILDILPAQVQRVENGGPDTPVAIEPSEEPVLPVCLPSPVNAVPAKEPVAQAPTLQPPPAAPVEATIRLNVGLLDSLMTLAGELVLGRNQLNEAVLNHDEQGIRAGAHRVSR